MLYTAAATTTTPLWQVVWEVSAVAGVVAEVERGDAAAVSQQQQENSSMRNWTNTWPALTADA